MSEQHQTCLSVPDSPKAIRETLCVAQTRIGTSELDFDRQQEHIARIQRLIDECDRHRPVGPDGKHNNRHTPTCGCDGSVQYLLEDLRERIARSIEMAAPSMPRSEMVNMVRCLPLIYKQGQAHMKIEMGDE